MLDVTHSQVDVETAFGVLSLFLIFIQTLASIKCFLAFCEFLDTAKDC